MDTGGTGDYASQFGATGAGGGAFSAPAAPQQAAVDPFSAEGGAGIAGVGLDRVPV